jgi:hypothetical protein
MVSGSGGPDTYKVIKIDDAEDEQRSQPTGALDLAVQPPLEGGTGKRAGEHAGWFSCTWIIP